MQSTIYLKHTYSTRSDMTLTSLASSLSSRTYTVYCDTMPFGCSGGFQLTRIDSADIKRAFIALGASGTVKTRSVISAEVRMINNNHS